MPRIVRISDMTDEEKEKWKEQVVDRNEEIKSNKENETKRANRLFNEYAEKNGSHDTSKHTTTIGELRKAYKDSPNYDTINNSLNEYYRNNKNKSSNEEKRKNNSWAVNRMLAKSGKTSEQVDKSKVITLPKASNASNDDIEIDNNLEKYKYSFGYSKLKSKKTNDNTNKNNLPTATQIVQNLKDATPAELEANNIPIISNNDPRLQLARKKFSEYTSEDYKNATELSQVAQVKQAEQINELSKNHPVQAFGLNTLMNLAGGMMQSVSGVNNTINTIGSAGTKGIEKIANIAGNEELEEKAKKLYDKKISEGSYINGAGNTISGINQYIENGAIKTAGNVASTIGNQLMSAGLGGSTGLTGSTIQAVGVAGSSSQEVLNENKDNIIQALLTGGTKGLISKGTEDIFDANILSRGAKKTSIQKQVDNWIANSFKSDTGKIIAEKISRSTGRKCRGIYRGQC